MFEVLHLVLENTILATKSNYNNNLRTINISSSEINELKADFVKKCNDLYTEEEMEALSNDESLISRI